jgi:hypothetical protein
MTKAGGSSQRHDAKSLSRKNTAQAASAHLEVAVREVCGQLSDAVDVVLGLTPLQLDAQRDVVISAQKQGANKAYVELNDW